MVIGGIDCIDVGEFIAYGGIPRDLEDSISSMVSVYGLDGYPVSMFSDVHSHYEQCNVDLMYTCERDSNGFVLYSDVRHNGSMGVMMHYLKEFYLDSDIMRCIGLDGLESTRHYDDGVEVCEHYHHGAELTMVCTMYNDDSTIEFESHGNGISEMLMVEGDELGAEDYGIDIGASRVYHDRHDINEAGLWVGDSNLMETDERYFEYDVDGRLIRYRHIYTAYSHNTVYMNGGRSHYHTRVPVPCDDVMSYKYVDGYDGLSVYTGDDVLVLSIPKINLLYEVEEQ